VLIAVIILSLVACFSKNRARYYTREDHLSGSKYRLVPEFKFNCSSGEVRRLKSQTPGNLPSAGDEVRKVDRKTS